MEGSAICPSMALTTSGAMAKRSPAIALTIAGSDSSGGAGLQADLRTFARAGVYGLSVVTAVTAQNTSGVKEVFPLPPDQVGSQLEAILTDMTPAATKIGMLAAPQIVAEVVLRASARQLGRLIVDPVLGSTSGQSLAEPGLEHELVRKLLPLCDLVTPNVEEAMRLTGVKINNAEDAKEAALAFTEMNVRAICITGGHLPGDPIDILFDGKDFTDFPGKRRGDYRTAFHGSGCVFSAGVAGYLALGMELAPAVAGAKRLAELAIDGAVRPGKGMAVAWGVMNHPPETTA